MVEGVVLMSRESVRDRIESRDTVAPSRTADSTIALGNLTELRTVLNTVPAMAAPSKLAPLRSTCVNFAVSSDAWLNCVFLISAPVKKEKEKEKHAAGLEPTNSSKKNNFMIISK